MGLFGSAAGAIAGGVSSLIGGALSNSAARHAASQQHDWNVSDYQHRYQWSMKDMQAAGLNPILAATQGIGGSINGASALSSQYNLGEGVTAGMSADAAGNSAKAANKQADTAQKLSDGQIKLMAANTILSNNTAKKYEAETYGISLANKLAEDNYDVNKAIAAQNLENAKKQGAYIDDQRANLQFMRDVVMPAQAFSYTAAGNASNSSADYNNKLGLLADSDAEYRKYRNSDYKDLGVSDDGGIFSTGARIFHRGLSAIGDLINGK